MKVLFFAEGATLAHVARPWLLAEALSKEGCEVVFACPPAACWITRGSTIEVVPLRTQPPELFARRLQRGQPLYDLATLEAYLRADLALLDAHRPDLVVGDFRLSLSVGARLAKLPYITLCDAYWAPETAFEPVVPVLPLTRFTPIPLAQAIFRLAAPLAFRAHAAPMEALRRAHGLPGFDGDLRRSYTDADLRLFANPQELFPSTRTHEGARFIGPMAWSPDMPLPDDFPDEPDLVFVSMGSSGSVEVLAHLFAALTRLRLPAVVATAGRPIPPIPSGSGIRSYDFVPARAAIAHSRMVVCNGGSPVTNLAYLAGKPLLGIPANMDQLMNMRALVRAGVGQSIRADRAAPRALEQALKTPPAAPEPTVADDPATLGQRLLALRRWS